MQALLTRNFVCVRSDFWDIVRDAGHRNLIRESTFILRRLFLLGTAECAGPESPLEHALVISQTIYHFLSRAEVLSFLQVSIVLRHDN